MPVQRHGFVDSSHPTPGYLFRRGQTRVGLKDLIYFYDLAEKKNYYYSQCFFYSFLYFTSMAPKTMDLHPPALPRELPLLSLLSSVIGACFWLVVVCNSIDRRPPKVTVYFLFDIFFASNKSPPTIGCRPPTRSNPRVPPLQHSFYCGRQLLVDCCVLPINGSHLRPQCILNLLFSCIEFVASNDWMPPSHTFQPPCASSQTSFLPQPPTSS